MQVSGALESNPIGSSIVRKQFDSPTLYRSRGLGLLSVAYGLARVISPDRVTDYMGLAASPRSRALMRVAGTRDFVAGVGLLARPKSLFAIWSRVAGDVLDLVLLGVSISGSASTQLRGKKPLRTRLAAAATVGITAADTLLAARSTRASDLDKPPSLIHVRKTITINRTPEEVYNFWRDLENLPRFLDHLESVRVQNGRSTWRAKGPAGTAIEWQAEVVQDVPNESIGWRSIEGASVPNRGVVRFKHAPGGRSTELIVELKYQPPAGKLGTVVARLFGAEPSMQIATDLRKLKQILETGEILHSDASIHRGMHPARPSKKPETSGKVRDT